MSLKCACPCCGTSLGLQGHMKELSSQVGWHPLYRPLLCE